MTSYRVTSQPFFTLRNLFLAESHLNQLSVILVNRLELLSVQIKVGKVFTSIWSIWSTQTLSSSVSKAESDKHAWSYLEVFGFPFIVAIVLQSPCFIFWDRKEGDLFLGALVFTLSIAISIQKACRMIGLVYLDNGCDKFQKETRNVKKGWEHFINEIDNETLDVRTIVILW